MLTRPFTRQLSTIEFSQIQQQVLQSLNKGSQVLSELQKDMTLAKVENIMDRVGDGVAAQRVRYSFHPVSLKEALSALFSDG